MLVGWRLSEIVLEGGPVSAIWYCYTVSAHSKIAWIYASSMRAELAELLRLLRHPEVRLASKVSVGREELVFWLVLDVRAGRTRASHVGTLEFLRKRRCALLVKGSERLYYVEFLSQRLSMSRM